MRQIVRALHTAERRIMEPHLDALRRAQENLRFVVDALRGETEDGAEFDTDTLSFYREVPEPET